MNIKNFVLNILFPPRCVFCGRFLEPNKDLCICGKCGDDIRFCSESICCSKCGKPLTSFGEKQLCYFCLNEKRAYFKRIVSVFVYDGIVRDAVLKFKKFGLKKHTETFAKCMMAIINQEYNDIEFDFICGVLSHDKKKGFDQVDLLCKKLSSELTVKYKKFIFRKTRKTRKQSKLSRNERRENLKGSIAVKNKTDVMGKTVLLVDDVCTTRSTLIEYSGALKEAGAKDVFCITVATVENM